MTALRTRDRELVPLRDLLKGIEAGKSFGGAAPPAAEGEWGVIKVSAMTWGTFRAHENKRISSGAVNAAYEIRPGDLLLSRANTTAYVGATVVVGEVRPRLLLSDKSLRLVPRDDVDGRWLQAMLSSPGVRTQMSAKASGTKESMRNISQATLLGIKVPAVSLAEQRRIVDVLEDHFSRLDAGAATAATASRRLRVLEDGMLAAEYALGPRSLTTAELPPAEGVDDSALPVIPATWSWRRLGYLADVVGGVAKDANKQADPICVEVPYLRVANVQRGYLDLSRVTTIRVPPKQATALRLLPGDVLLNEGGDRDKLGRGWVWEGQVTDCIHQNHVFRARVRDDQILPELLSRAANTIGAGWCQRNGTQSVNLASISLRKIKLMPVPVPPRGEQEAITARVAERMESCRRLETAVRVARARGEALRRALLQAAFTGQLTGAASDAEVVEELTTLA